VTEEHSRHSEAHIPILHLASLLGRRRRDGRGSGRRRDARGKLTAVVNGDDRTERTRAGYDAVASEYAAAYADELARKPLDRALLAALIEQTPAGAPIADIGCGPGHVAAWMTAHGATALGIDLSQRMIEVARAAYPETEYRVGDMRSLPATDNAWAAAVAFYSIIHLPPEDLALAFAEFRRVLRPQGLLLLAFHCGSEVRHRDEWWGHDVSLDFRFLEVAQVEEALASDGFAIEARLERLNYPDENPTRRAYVFARAPK
jgi:ubiquinone/menaquinone biosynthesis C-methylase UbiE